MSMKEILKYELSAFLLSLSTCDGSLTKTVKSKLFQAIQDWIKVLSAPMRNTPSIFGMVLLQKISLTLETFGALSDYLLNKTLRESCRVAYFVTDQYLKNSIKLMERNRRKTSQSVRMVVKRQEQCFPKQFKKYIGCSENKVDLVAFLLRDWSTPTPAHLKALAEKELFVTVRDLAFCLVAINGTIQVNPIPQVASKQEEADTKMFLCSEHAHSLGFLRVNIVTVDSDVTIVSLY